MVVTAAKGPACAPAYRPRVGEFRRLAIPPDRRSVNLFEATFQRGAQGRTITRPWGFLVLAMYEEGVRGTLHIWRHNIPWRFRVQGAADIGLEPGITTLKLAAKFRPGTDQDISEETVAETDYVRYVGGRPANRIVRDVFGGGALVQTGIPEETRIERRSDTTDGRTRPSIWACGTSAEQLWHFEMDGELRDALQHDFLRVIGVPNSSRAGVARMLVEDFTTAVDIAKLREKFTQKYQHPENPVVIAWSPEQRARVSGRVDGDKLGRVYRVGDKQIGICRRARPHDQFTFMGSVVKATLPRSRQKALDDVGMGVHAAIPVFFNHTEPARGGDKYFSWFAPMPLSV